MWRILPLTWISNFSWDLKIQFNFNPKLKSAIGDFSKSWHLASYVSRHNAIAYDTRPHKWSCQTWKSCWKKPRYGKKLTVTIWEIMKDVRIVPYAIRQWHQRWWWLCSTVSGPKLDLSYFVRGVDVRHIVARGAQSFSINMLKHYLKHPT